MSQVELHRAQSIIFSDIFQVKEARNFTAVCSRGFGKSYLLGVSAMTAVNELVSLPAYVPNKRVAIIAPTFDQVVDIYFPLIAYEFGAKEFAQKSSADEGRFLFPGNTELRLISYEAVERMRGKGFYFVGWDEVSSCKKGIDPKLAWQEVIQPCIATRWSEKNAKLYNAPSPGRSLTISTPKGFNFLHTMFNYATTISGWKSYQYDYTHSPFIDAEEIARLRDELDPISFASEYEAKFAESGNNVFYSFSRAAHVRMDIADFASHEVVHLAIDFNVGLQCTSAFALRGNQMHFIEEFKGHPDTETLAKFLANHYKGHKLIAFPDPTGKARKTSATIGKTDFSILQEYGITVMANSSPPIVDSVNAVNRKLLSASNKIGIFAHPRCVNLINSLERTKWANATDTAMIDKKEGVEHFSDGVRYAVWYLFPITSSKPSVISGKTF